MKKCNFYSRIVSLCLLSLCLAAPAVASESPLQDGTLVATSSKAKKAAEAPEKIQKKLDEFAYNTICSINRCVIPSSGKKEVKKNADGTFTARYIEIDPSTITTSYKKPDNVGPVSYIGYMNYEEVEYICTAQNQKEAVKGPFAPKRREIMTELVKYVKGKWTY